MTKDPVISLVKESGKLSPINIHVKERWIVVPETWR